MAKAYLVSCFRRAAEEEEEEEQEEKEEKQPSTHPSSNICAAMPLPLQKQETYMTITSLSRVLLDHVHHVSYACLIIIRT